MAGQFIFCGMCDHGEWWHANHTGRCLFTPYGPTKGDGCDCPEFTTKAEA